MITFKEYFLKENIMFGKVVNSRHTQLPALYKTGLNTKSVGLVADRYSKNSLNRDRNTGQKTGIITPNEAEEYINKHNLNREELAKGIPANLGKRPFQLSQNPKTKQFSITKIN